MNDKPTQEQIKEVLEWCGFKFLPHLSSEGYTYKTTALLQYPNGFTLLINKGESIPIDLNNLASYGLPKARDILNESETIFFPFHKFLMRWVYAIAIKREDPALSLFSLLLELAEKVEKAQESTIALSSKASQQ